MTNQKLEELKKKIIEAADAMDKVRLALTENINLEHVLMAIEAQSLKIELNTLCFGRITLWGCDARDEYTGKWGDWHLSTPLHLQSEETINFLHSILCPKN